MNIPKDLKPFFPTNCPHCKTDLELINGIHLTCTNPDCEGIKGYLFSQGVGTLELFGVGGAMIDLIWESGFKKSTDLLNPEKFNKQTLLAKGLISDGKTVDNLFDEISKINELTLRQVIIMLGFKGMGSTTSTQVANKIAGIEYSFAGLEKSIVSGFEIGDAKRQLVEETVAELSKFIRIVYPVSKQGITYIEMTGSPKGAGFNSKDEFLDAIAGFKFEHGKLADSKYLITDDLKSTSSKMTTAKKKGIEILTYSDFIATFCSGVAIPVRQKTVAQTTAVSAPKTKSLF